jgi:hypothetical protein
MSRQELKELDEKEEHEMQRINTTQFVPQQNHKFNSVHDNMDNQASPIERHQGKIPESITSMPQISVYQTPNFDSHNENI